jgi:hypothetical protein
MLVEMEKRAAEVQEQHPNIDFDSSLYAPLARFSADLQVSISQRKHITMHHSSIPSLVRVTNCLPCLTESRGPRHISKTQRLGSKSD